MLHLPWLAPRESKAGRLSAVVLGAALLAVGTGVLAEATGVPTLLAQVGNSYSNELFLAPFKYEASKTPAGGVANDADAPKRPAKEQRIVDLNTTGDYGRAGTEGLAFMADEKPDAGLQLIIANSLAWSGRLKEAKATYQSITDEAVVDDANVGIANILRWQGRDEAAAPIYRDILAKNPDHVDAKAGLDLAQRELAPRTAITVGGTGDSSDIRSRSVSVAHRWRDDSGYRVFEVEGGAMVETAPGVEAPLQDVTVRYQDLGLELRPTLELTVPTNIQNSMFGNLRLQFDDGRAQVDVGRVNWGKYSTNAKSLLARETATRLGFSIKRAFEIGEASAKADYYNISDGNAIWATDARLNSTLRPFGPTVKPYVGVETRKANFSSGNYWSPADGAGTLYGGLSGEWPIDALSVYAGIQAGLGLYGEAGSGWVVTGGAKYWMTSNYGLSFNLFGMTNSRAGSTYNAHAANVVLEKIWR